MKDRCSTNRCQCQKAGLGCTDLCGCPDGEDCVKTDSTNIKDVFFEDDSNDYYSDDSDYD